MARNKTVSRIKSTTRTRTMFGPAKHKELARIIKISSPREAQYSVYTLLKKYEAASPEGRTTILRSAVLAANRAEASLNRKTLSEKERDEMRSVTATYRLAVKQMHQIQLRPTPVSQKQIERIRYRASHDAMPWTWWGGGDRHYLYVDKFEAHQRAEARALAKRMTKHNVPAIVISIPAGKAIGNRPVYGVYRRYDRHLSRVPLSATPFSSEKSARRIARNIRKKAREGPRMEDVERGPF